MNESLNELLLDTEQGIGLAISGLSCWEYELDGLLVEEGSWSDNEGCRTLGSPSITVSNVKKF